MGPAGAGKTSLGRRIARNPGWVHVSEDDIWGEIGHPSREPRTDAGQERVHALAHRYIEAELREGRRVVFDFLVYENPPRRLADYQAHLARRRIRFATRVLRPTVDAVLERQRARGRRSDLDAASRRRHAEHQLACLHATEIAPAWVVDSSELTLEDTYAAFFRELVEEEADATT